MIMGFIIPRLYWKGDFSRARIPSGVTFSFGGKNYLLIFFEILTSILATWRLAIFKDATKIQNGRQRSTPIFFVGA